MNEENIYNEGTVDIAENDEGVMEDSSSKEAVGEAILDAAKTNVKSSKHHKKAVDDIQNAKIDELTRDLQRTRADFENYRRQSEIQKNQYGNVVKNTTIMKILPLIDDIERAVDANPDTLGPIAKNIDKALKSLGLSKISSKPGEAFNPELHDAVLVEGDGDEEQIGETMRSGYYYDGEVVRPAMVKVIRK